MPEHKPIFHSTLDIQLWRVEKERHFYAAAALMHKSKSSSTSVEYIKLSTYYKPELFVVCTRDREQRLVYSSEKRYEPITDKSPYLPVASGSV